MVQILQEINNKQKSLEALQENKLTEEEAEQLSDLLDKLRY